MFHKFRYSKEYYTFCLNIVSLLFLNIYQNSAEGSVLPVKSLPRQCHLLHGNSMRSAYVLLLLSLLQAR